MQAKKEIVAGRLYIQTMYSAGMLPGMRPVERRRREKAQTEAKDRINKTERDFYLVQLFECNFRPGRDLFVELSFRDEPTRKDEDRALQRFHRRMKKYFAARGREYRYIIARETHNRDGDSVRAHYHLICVGTGQRMQSVIAQNWDAGSVDVRTLRQFFGSFKDTCDYLMKERKEKGERAFRTSRNLRRPEEPLRRKVPECEIGEVPPGVDPIKVEMNGSNPYGRYSIIIGNIVDQAAFDRYWAKAKLDRRRAAESANWRRYARTKIHKMDN